MIGWLVARAEDFAMRLAYKGIWWVLSKWSSRLRFLDDCTAGDSWATDGMFCWDGISRATGDGRRATLFFRDEVGCNYFSRWPSKGVVVRMLAEKAAAWTVDGESLKSSS
jgi:hypothetical protein